MTNVLPWTIWMPLLDTEHTVHIASPTTSETVVTTPLIPGLELHLPTGTVIRDAAGQTVRDVGITPVPIDRTPFPLPPSVDVPVYFTIQPGGADVLPDGAWLVYPNYRFLPPGARGDFWYYEPDEEGWEVAGKGTVTPDGEQVVPDPGVRIHDFAGAMFGNEKIEPSDDSNCNFRGTGRAVPAEQFGGRPDVPPCTGDPVDPSTGLLRHAMTDLMLPGPMPVEIERIFRQNDVNDYEFGQGMAMPYDMYLFNPDNPNAGGPYVTAFLLLSGGRRVEFNRVTSGTDWTNASFIARKTPGEFFGAVMGWNGTGWTITTRDGTKYRFTDSGPLQDVVDRFRNQVAFSRRGGVGGSIEQAVASPSGRWVGFTYGTSGGANGFIVEATDPLGRKVDYQYDSSGRLTDVIDAQQMTLPPANRKAWHYTWPAATTGNASTELVSIRDPRNITFVTNTFVAGRVVRQDVPTPNNGAFTYAYTTDANGLVTRTDVTDPNGNVTRYDFTTGSLTDRGYLTTVTRAFGTGQARTTTFERNSNTNQMTASVDSFHNRRTEYTHDANGNLRTITRLAATADAVTWTMDYEPKFDQVSSINDPLNHAVSFEYAPAGCLQTVTDAESRSWAYGCTAAGRVETVTDPLQNQSTVSYAFGDVSSVTDAVGRKWSAFVDAAGRAVRLTDPLGYVTKVTFNGLDLATQVTNARTKNTSFSYDEDGNVTQVQDALLRNTVFTYSPMNLLASRRDPLLRTETFTYDDNGNVLTWTDRKNQAMRYCYDALDRMTFAGYKATGPNPTCQSGFESTIAYGYDGGSRLTSINDSTGGAITIGWDDLDQRSSEQTSLGTVTYTIDDAGRLQQLDVTGAPNATVYGYDQSNRVTSVTSGSQAVGVAYDAAGRRDVVTLPSGVTEDHGYNGANDITGIVYRNGGSTLGDLAYALDPAGRLETSYGSFARTGLPTATSANATYDANNRLTAWNGTALSYDNNGNPTTFGSTTYAWNARNQLSATSAGSSSLAYDGLGRRSARTVSGVTTKYLHAGLDVVQELNGSGGVTANLLTGLGTDEVFRRSETAGATRDLLTDRLGSTLALADSAGSLQTSYTYEPFGKATSTGAASTNGFQFTGRENDGATGLYFYRARYYSPTFQRFVSEDPIGYASRDANLYTYVGNSPNNFTDSLGLERQEDDDNVCGFLAWRCWDDAWRSFIDSSNCLEGTSLCGFRYRLFQGYQCAQGGLIGGFFGSFIGPGGTIGGAVVGCAGGVTIVPPGPPIP
jgi:RHS repeat-associated protein